MSNATYGYARVSSKDQNLDRQLDAKRGCQQTSRKRHHIRKVDGKRQAPLTDKGIVHEFEYAQLKNQKSGFREK